MSAFRGEADVPSSVVAAVRPWQHRSAGGARQLRRCLGLPLVGVSGLACGLITNPGKLIAPPLTLS